MKFPSADDGEARDEASLSSDAASKACWPGRCETDLIYSWLCARSCFLCRSRPSFSFKAGLAPWLPEYASESVEFIDKTLCRRGRGRNASCTTLSRLPSPRPKYAASLNVVEPRRPDLAPAPMPSRYALLRGGCASPTSPGVSESASDRLSHASSSVPSPPLEPVDRRPEPVMDAITDIVAFD